MKTIVETDISRRGILVSGAASAALTVIPTADARLPTIQPQPSLME